jgi:hypothetical protein
LAIVLEPWIFSPWNFAEEAADLESRYSAAFGIVLGPLVEEALYNSEDATSRRSLAGLARWEICGAKSSLQQGLRF